MAVLLAEPVRAKPWLWPRRWVDQEPLLERQHDGLEAYLAELLSLHGPMHPAWSAAEAVAIERGCRRLIWDLRLHLRLEERWLSAQGYLCPGHRAVHLQAVENTKAALLKTSGDREARLRWLLELQSWFTNHRHGPDATAYGIARSNASARR
jgi:hemerythrin